MTVPRRPIAVLLLLAGSAIAGSAYAHDTRQGALHIGHSWTKLAPDGGIAEVYFGLINRGERPDRIVGAEAAVAARVGLAETSRGAVMPLQGIELPAGWPVPLRPGRLHIRLEGLKRALVQGDSFPLTLHFAVSPPVEISVVVESEAGH